MSTMVEMLTIKIDSQHLDSRDVDYQFSEDDDITVRCTPGCTRPVTFHVQGYLTQKKTPTPLEPP